MSIPRRKSDWKKAVLRCFNMCEEVRIKAKAGEILTLADIYKPAHRLNELGERSITLAREAARESGPKVLEDIQNLTHQIAEYSAIMYDLALKRGLTTRHFPLFESRLAYTAVTDLRDPVEELNRIMTEGEPNE